METIISMTPHRLVKVKCYVIYLEFIKVINLNYNIFETILAILNH